MGPMMDQMDERSSWQADYHATALDRIHHCHNCVCQGRPGSNPIGRELRDGKSGNEIDLESRSRMTRPGVAVIIQRTAFHRAWPRILMNCRRSSSSNGFSRTV